MHKMWSLIQQAHTLPARLAHLSRQLGRVLNSKIQLPMTVIWLFIKKMLSPVFLRVRLEWEKPLTLSHQKLLKKYSFAVIPILVVSILTPIIFTTFFSQTPLPMKLIKKNGETLTYKGKIVPQSEEKYIVNVTSGNTTLNLQGVSTAPEDMTIYVDQPVEADTDIVTDVLFVDDTNLAFETATVELSVQADKKVNAILTCPTWDFDSHVGTCSNWKISEIVPTQTGQTIAFNVDHFSAYAGAYLEILNVQTNLTMGDIWEVRFNTYGTSDLTIEAIDGTIYGTDVEFLEFYCGDTKYDAEVYQNSKVFIPNYSCDGQLSRLVDRSVTFGKHVLQFSYGETILTAKNFACNVGTLSDTCEVNASQAMTNGETISGTGNLLIRNLGNLTTNAGESFSIDMDGSVTIESGGNITGNLTSLTAASLDVQTGGNININTKGFSSSSGSGQGVDGVTNNGAGGGGYGGAGGRGNTSVQGGPIYGDLETPTDFGSGGGLAGSNQGGAGGGAAVINVTGTVTVAGTITANGGTGAGSSTTVAGGGSGGTISITANTLAGAGSITANGGNGGNGTSDGGGGGGGRIALYYTTKTFNGTLQATGGTGPDSALDGAAGTVYEKPSGQTDANLTWDNGNKNRETSSGLATGSYTFNTLNITGNTLLNIPDGLTVNVTNTFNPTASYQLSNTSSTGTLTYPTPFDLTTTGTTTFIGDQTKWPIRDVTVSSGTLSLTGSYSVRNVVIQTGSTLTHESNAATHTSDLQLNVSGDVTLNGTGTINVNAKGYASTSGPGQGVDGVSNNGAGGAGYGGAGGRGNTSVQGGPAYGDLETPTDLGSGGGLAGSNAGGAGGGAVILTVDGTTTIGSSASITSNGSNGAGSGTTVSGGGSGGTVSILTNTLAGSGSITANGGNGSNGTSDGGGGGGGRISVFSTTSSYSGTISVNGGIGPDSALDGSSGTTYNDFSAPTVSQNQVCDILGNGCTIVGELANPQESYSITSLTGTAAEPDTTVETIQISLKDSTDNLWYNPATSEFDQGSELFFDVTTTSQTLPYTGTVDWTLDTTNVPWEIDHEYQTRTQVSNVKITTTSDVLDFVFTNSPPTVSNVTASQSASGTVAVAYDVTDSESASTTIYLAYDVGITLAADLNTGTAGIEVSDASLLPTSGSIVIEDEIISYTGKSGNTLNGTITRGANNTINNAHTSGEEIWPIATGGSGNIGSVANGTGKAITWNAKTDLDGLDSDSIKVQVVSNDGASSSMVGKNESLSFALDVKDPEFTANFRIDASLDTPLIYVPCTDESSLQMRLGTTSDLTGTSYTAQANSINFSLAGITFANGMTVYGQCRDAFSNVTSIRTAVIPGVPANVFYQDVSNPELSAWREFVAWGVVDATAITFDSYNIYRSDDGGAFNLVTSINNRQTNYFVDQALDNTIEYTYKVTAEDVNGNISAFSSTVSDTPDGAGGTDLTPPSLTGVASSNVSTTQASIAWTSNKLSNSTVYYKASSTYPGANKASYDGSIGVPSMVNNHTVVLSNLSPNTKYYFLVESEDASGNTGSSASSTYNFTTSEGPIISNVTVPLVFDTEAKISWTTNISASSSVIYSTNSNLNSPTTVNRSGDPTTNHEVTLTGLTAGTKYYFQVKAVDADDNETIDSNVVDGVTTYYTLTTTSDELGPVISNVAVALVAAEGVTITWQTNEVATSQVLWDADNVLNNSTTQTSVYTNQHAVTLTDLDPETTYYYQVVSQDKAGNSSTSTPVASVTTVDDPNASPDTTAPTFSNLDVTEITSTTAKVTWLTNETTDSFVKYGTAADNLGTTVGEIESTTSHSVTLENLSSSTVYYFVVTGRDADGNVGETSVASFTTSASTNEQLEEEEETNNELVDLVVSIVEKASKSFLEKVLAALIKNPSISSLSEDQVVNLVEDLSEKSISAPSISTSLEIEPAAQSAVVKWTTNKPANSLVAYATDEEYNAEALEPYTTEAGDSQAYTTDHTITLLGLQPNTTYHIQARSKDRFGPTVTSVDTVFTTTALTPEIQDLSLTSANETSVVISWKTTVPTRRTVTIIDVDTGDDVVYSDGSYLKAHTFEATELSPSSNYVVTISAADENGETITSPPTPFSTITTSSPPKIEDVKVVTSLISGKVEKVQSIISWKTDKPSSSKVLYQQGVKTDESAQEIVDASLKREHILITSAFAPGQVYKYRVVSSDLAGNTAESQDFTLLTPKPQESVVDLIVNNVEEMFGFLRR